MSRIRTVAAIASFTAAAGLFVAGPVMLYKGFDARDQVRQELVAQRITTPDDASRPNIAVDDGPSAIVQADIIEKHKLEATGGKTYAELGRTDPARQVAFQGDMLRTALLSSALAWNVANLVIGLGALLAGLGVVFLLVGIALRKPETVIFAPATAARREEALS